MYGVISHMDSLEPKHNTKKETLPTSNGRIEKEKEQENERRGKRTVRG
jgi:hypothetical protein